MGTNYGTFLYYIMPVSLEWDNPTSKLYCSSFVGNRLHW